MVRIPAYGYETGSHRWVGFLGVSTCEYWRSACDTGWMSIAFVVRASVVIQRLQRHGFCVTGASQEELHVEVFELKQIIVC